MTHRNNSKTWGKTPAELVLERKSPTHINNISNFFIIRNRFYTSFVQPENSNWTLLVSDNQIALLKPDDIKTELTDQQSTESQSWISRDYINVASSNSNQGNSLSEGEQQLRASTSNKSKKKQPEIFGEAIATKKRRCDISQRSELKVYVKTPKKTKTTSLLLMK